MEVTQRSGELHTKGSLGQDWMTVLMASEFVAVKRRVWRDAGSEEIMVDKSESKPPSNK